MRDGFFLSRSRHICRPRGLTAGPFVFPHIYEEVYNCRKNLNLKEKA